MGMDRTSARKSASHNGYSSFQPPSAFDCRRLTQICFGFFKFQPDTLQLFKHGVRVKLQSKPAQLLRALVSEPGELVTREMLRAKLWPPGTFVDFEGSLNTAVNRLRATLNDPPDDPLYIETVPRLGYRFIFPATREHNDISMPDEILLRDSEHDPVPRRTSEASFPEIRKRAGLFLAACGAVAALAIFFAARVAPASENPPG